MLVVRNLGWALSRDSCRAEMSISHLLWDRRRVSTIMSLLYKHQTMRLLRMTPTQTIAVSIRLFAITLAYMLILHSPIIFIDAATAGLNISIPIVVISLWLSIILLLWHFPIRVANAILRETTPITMTTSSLTAWFETGCCLLGLYFLGELIPNIALDIQPFMTYGAPSAFKEALLIRDGIQLTYSICLLVGTKRIQRALQNLRGGCAAK